MLNLHTGLPGNGKTLYTLSTVEKRRIAENRTVYYTGIKELQLDWIQMEKPAEWYNLPSGSIIVIDECQQLFTPRPNGAPIPKAESELETHRHKGFDIYLITQDPTFIPSHARKLCNVHRHMMRKFGSKWVTVHQWEGVRDNCAKSRKDSIESQWIDDTSMYGKYKSADVITQKFRVPVKLIAAGLLPIAVIGAAYYFYQRRLTAPAPAVQPAASPASSPGTAQPAPAPKRVFDPASFEPRVAGLPFTAPRYDELTAPVRVPAIAGCVWFEKTSRGHCYTQPGTQVFPPVSFIKQFIERGMFEDFERGPAVGEVAGGGQRPPDNSRPLTRPPPALPAAIGSQHVEMGTSAVLPPPDTRSTVQRDGEVLAFMRKREYIR